MWLTVSQEAPVWNQDLPMILRRIWLLRKTYCSPQTLQPRGGITLGRFRLHQHLPGTHDRVPWDGQHVPHTQGVHRLACVAGSVSLSLCRGVECKDFLFPVIAAASSPNSPPAGLDALDGVSARFSHFLQSVAEISRLGSVRCSFKIIFCSEAASCSCPPLRKPGPSHPRALGCGAL